MKILEMWAESPVVIQLVDGKARLRNKSETVFVKEPVLVDVLSEPRESPEVEFCFIIDDYAAKQIVRLITAHPKLGRFYTWGDCILFIGNCYKEAILHGTYVTCDDYLALGYRDWAKFSRRPIALIPPSDLARISHMQ